MNGNQHDTELNEVKAKSKPKAEEHTVEFSEDKFFGNTRLQKDDPNFNDEDVVVAMKNVHKTYLLGIEGVPALRGVSLTIKRGEFVCIFGTSGGGKTTMLNIMGTIDKPTKGEIRLCGTRVTNSTKDSELSDIRLSKLGFVFQTFNLLSSLTALENVEMPMILHGVMSQSERRQRAKELLDMVGLGKRFDHVPSQLSGGEQQRVTIARAIANNPEILLLDEPTGDLDTVNTHVVMKLLTELNQKNNITMVMVTHDVALKNFADRIIWMRDGKIQRIEQVPKHKKLEAIRKVEEELQNAQQKKQLIASGQFKRQEGVIEYRKPTDYKPHSHYVKSVSNMQPATKQQSPNNNSVSSRKKSKVESDDETAEAENSQESITSSNQLIPNLDHL